MRLIELDLERYGPFTGKRLSFRPDARLHVVYGPNEAGKSCSLAAVTDLFFGIASRTNFDFVHQAKTLRIGATIVDRAGKRLSFRRQKNKPALVSESDAPLPDDALAPFLGGLSREVFCRAFGLDAAALRASGDDLRRSDGELGAALFSAASGLRGMNDLRATLEKEADGIFATRAAKDRAFYQALGRYDDARAAIRTSEFRGGPLKKLRDDIDAQRDALQAIRDRRAQIAQEKERLERLRRASPIIRQIDLAAESLRSFEALSPAPESLSQEIRASLEALEGAASRLARAQANERELSRGAAGLVPDDALLAHAAEIERLASESGAWAKARQDLPRVQAEADGFDADLDALAVRLGLPDWAAVMAGQPTDAARARLEALLEDGAKRQAAFDSARRAERSEAESLAVQQRERETRGALRDPRPMREALTSLADALRRAEQAGPLATEIAAERAALAEDAARLTPSVADLDALARAPLPSRETITACRVRADDVEARLRRADETASELDRQIGELAARLARLESGGTAPTFDRIEAARGARDAAWSGLRAHLLGQDVLAAAALSDATLRFETSLAEADRLSDAAVSDAERVAGHRLASEELAQRRATLAQVQTARAGVEAEREALAAEWAGLWSSSAIAPRSPAEMLAWRGEAALLLQRREKLGQKQAQLAALEEEARALDAPLAALAETVGVILLSGTTALLKARRIEAEIGRIADAWDAARDAEALLGETSRRAEAARTSLAEAEAAMSEWRARLAEALPAIGLPATATAQEARAALEAWKEVPACLRNRADRTRRAEGIRRDLQGFETALATLTNAVAPDLADAPPDTALRTLRERLAGARDTRTRRQELDKQIEPTRRELQAAGDAEDAARNALAEVAARGHASPGDDLAELARQLAERDRIRAGIREKRDQLAAATDGVAEEALREALETHDPDSASATLARLADEDAQLDAGGQEAYAALDRMERQLAGLEDGVGAELALQQRRGAEAELVAAAREWAVLSLGALLIGAAVERQRVGRQEPMMLRAGALFSTITGGDFTMLCQRYDDRDVPHLTARRASGAEVALTDMSEGTRDQLYLALRLAYLEDYAARAEPAPFVGDDLFSTFDDERTEHGLAALAAIGETVQPILFTHHQYVVDAARRRLGDAVDIVLL